ncbi:MAG: transposase [Methyloprofundus sp.]|nr:transposase [Methyloprofundus sp.]
MTITQVCLYTILIQSATETLQSFADKRWKGTLGITVVLHTWGQQLAQHIHLHTIAENQGNGACEVMIFSPQ